MNQPACWVYLQLDIIFLSLIVSRKVTVFFSSAFRGCTGSVVVGAVLDRTEGCSSSRWTVFQGEPLTVLVLARNEHLSELIKRKSFAYTDHPTYLIYRFHWKTTKLMEALVIQNVCSGAGLPGFETQCYYLPALWPWASCSVSLCFSFLICDVRKLPYLPLGLVGGWAQLSM